MLVILTVSVLAFSETLAVGELIYQYSPKIFSWNSSNSVPRGLYLRLPPDHIETGDYVAFRPSEEILAYGREHGWEISDDLMFLKIVGAMSGQTYRVDPKNLMFFANERYIGQVFEVDREGLPLPVIRGDFVVEDGKFLPVGTSARSFDGRYFGTQPLSSIKYRMILVFSF